MGITGEKSVCHLRSYLRLKWKSPVVRGPALDDAETATIRQPCKVSLFTNMSSFGTIFSLLLCQDKLILKTYFRTAEVSWMRGEMSSNMQLL